MTTTTSQLDERPEVVEDQDVTALAALVCHPDPSMSGSAEFTFWADLREARHAEAELTPCGPHCIGSHTAVRLSAELEPRRRTTTPRTRGGDPHPAPAPPLPARATCPPRFLKKTNERIRS